MAEDQKVKKVKTKADTPAGEKKNIAYYTNVEVTDFDGNTFVINSTHPGPLRVETCHLSHPAYNPDKKVERKAKGHMEKFLEKQKRMDAANK